MADSNLFVDQIMPFEKAVATLKLVGDGQNLDILYNNPFAWIEVVELLAEKCVGELEPILKGLK